MEKVNVELKKQILNEYLDNNYNPSKPNFLHNWFVDVGTRFNAKDRVIYTKLNERKLFRGVEKYDECILLNDLIYSFNDDGQLVLNKNLNYRIKKDWFKSIESMMNQIIDRKIIEKRIIDEMSKFGYLITDYFVYDKHHTKIISDNEVDRYIIQNYFVDSSLVYWFKDDKRFAISHKFEDYYNIKFSADDYKKMDIYN